MHFRASNTYDYYRPSKCARRVALRHRRIEEAPRTEFDELLARLGDRHERKHLATLSGAVDLSYLKGDDDVHERETLAAIPAGAPVIYQPRFRIMLDLDGESCDLVGLPDFLVSGDGGYVVRDSKLARHIDDEHHPEIVLQLQLYGWIYEHAVGSPPAGLEVHAGSGEIVPVPYDGGDAALRFLRNLRRMRLASEDTYEPVGWSKCGGCAFKHLCWGQAERANDIALLPAVNQARAVELRELGVAAIRDVPAAIENSALRQIFYEGRKKPRLRDSAITLLRSAEAHISGHHMVIALPDLPDAPNIAVLDLEGLPPYQDELEKIYLWGLKVFGDRPSGHLLAQAGFGHDGDRQGWLDFLGVVARLIEEHGDLPFIHWSQYERTKVKLYTDRYGDPDGTAARLLASLVDLLAIVRKTVVLPLPSYGLKVVEKHVRFERRLSETGGTWAIARYIEATETSDPAARNEIMGQILAYNEEDIDATRAILEWLRKIVKAPVESSS